MLPAILSSDIKATYGEGLLKSLSRELTSEFGRGFSLANLKNFRKFYLTYPDEQKSYALRSLLSWTHHRLIMRVESPQAREYYIAETKLQNWSTRILERQIQTSTYQRLLSTQTASKSTPELDKTNNEPKNLTILPTEEELAQAGRYARMLNGEF